MSTFSSFEEIEAWRESRTLVKRIREICKRPNAQRDFVFVDQITRAARSVPANIVEGHDSLSSMEFVRFLGFAKRSASEVRGHLYDALDENYITKDEFLELTELSKKVCRMIAGLIKYLLTLDNNRRRLKPVT